MLRHRSRRLFAAAALVSILLPGLAARPVRGNPPEGATPQPASPATRPVVIQTGDLLCIGVTGLETNGDAESLKTVHVDSRGGVSLYYVGTVNVAGLTYTEAEKKIAAAYTAANVVRSAGVTLNSLPISKDAPAGATIRAGDRLSVKISDLSPASMTSRLLTVNPAGSVGIVFLGQVQVAGLSEAEAEKLIAKRYKEEAVIQDARISVLRLAADEATEPTIEPPHAVVVPPRAK